MNSKAASSGPCFTPRLPASERPTYPDFFPFLLRHGIKPTIQASVLSTLVAVLSFPLYDSAVLFWKAKQWPEQGFITASLVFVTTAMFFGYNSMYLLFEHLHLFEQYKIARRPGQQKATDKNFRFTLTRAAIGKLFINPWVIWFGVPVLKSFGQPAFDSAIPSKLEMFRQFLIAYWFNEFFFYWAHRAFHDSRLYRFHKEHHNYTGTIGFAAEHAGLLEQIVANITPTVGGCIFFGRHPFVLLVWIVIRLNETYDGHSGYCFAGTWLSRVGLLHTSTGYHDYHHTFSFRGNFGHPLLDYCCGTMDYWLKDGGSTGYVESQRKGAAAAGMKVVN